MPSRITDNPSFSYLSLAHLKLGFDQSQQMALGSQEGQGGRDNNFKRDETCVDGDKIHRWDSIRRHVPDIGSFQHDHSGVQP